MAVVSHRLLLGLLFIVILQVLSANTEDCDSPNGECPDEEYKLFGGISRWIIILGAILLIIFVIAFTIFFILVERRGREDKVVDEAHFQALEVQPLSIFERFRFAYKEFVFRCARKICLFSAEYPYFVITIALVVVFFLSRGARDIYISTDPIEIWSSPDSEAFTEKQYFEKHFDPLPREAHIILSYHGNPIQPSGDENQLSHILSHNILNQVLQLQQKIQSIRVLDNDDNTYVTLADVCVTPLGPETKQCNVRSVLNYWQNNQERLDFETTDKDGTPFNYKDHFQACVSDPSLLNDGTPLNQSCRGPLENSVLPDEVLGGYQDSNFDEATALFIYIPLLYYSDEDPRLTKTLLWEKAFLNLMVNYTIETLNISFSAERSLSDEQVLVDKKSTQLTILVSYSVMFVYMVFMIGQDQLSTDIKVGARIVIALTAILIILASAVSALAVAYSWGFTMTPIVIQVVPFLALSIGESNIFVILQKFSRLRTLRKSGDQHLEYLANILALCAPSITAATVSQAIAFFLASLFTDVPAIKSLSFCSGLSVVFNLVLQLTIFMSFLELEYRHREQIKNLFSIIKGWFKKEQGEDSPPPDDEESEEQGKIYGIFAKFYAPLLTSAGARYIVVLLAAISFYINLSVLGCIDVGLAKQNAVPKNSYLQKYYSDMDAFSRIGPELYFVVKSGYDYTTAEGQDKICSEHQCQLNSLTAQLKNASMYSARTKIAHPATSWLDDYLEWVNPQSYPVCCRRFDATPGKFCLPEVKNSSCVSCLGLNNNTSTSPRPAPNETEELVSQFLSQASTTECPIGGKLLSDSVSLQPDGSIGATYFATYFTTLIEPADYIHSYLKAKTISKQIEDVLNTFTETERNSEVFPYSDFFVYYSQYDNLVVRSVKTLAVTFCVMCIAKGLLLGLSLATIPLITLALILFTINLLALLFYLNIPFSEIALVNVIIGIGIASGLFIQVADHFSSQVSNETTTRLKRTEDLVSHTGSTLLIGDVLPKLLSFVGLFFVKNQLVQSNFTNVYLGMVGLLFFYGLVFVPVMMSFIGPVLQPTPNEVLLSRFLPLDPPEDTELTPILPDYGVPDAATADNNEQPISGQ